MSDCTVLVCAVQCKQKKHITADTCHQLTSSVYSALISSRCSKTINKRWPSMNQKNTIEDEKREKESVDPDKTGQCSASYCIMLYSDWLGCRHIVQICSQISDTEFCPRLSLVVKIPNLLSINGSHSGPVLKTDNHRFDRFSFTTFNCCLRHPNNIRVKGSRD